MNIAVVLLIMILLFLLALGKKIGFKAGIILVIAFVLLETAFLLVKNDWILYPSPEKAFESVNNGRVRAQLVLVGEETAFVMGQDGSTSRYAIVDRTEKGWKIGDAAGVDATSQLFPDGRSVMIFHKRNTGDYYVELLMLNGEAGQVSDSCGSEFQRVDVGSRGEAYVARIREPDGDYALTVDGDAYPLPVPWAAPLC